MSFTGHRRRDAVGAAFLLLLSAYGGDTFATPTPLQANVGGTWDAQFSGTVEGAGTSQTDDLVIELRQNGSEVTGTLRSQGTDLSFPLSGNVQGTTFKYVARGKLGPTCEVTIVAETKIDIQSSRLSGEQTQSTCEGTAVGQVTAVRR